MHEVKSDHVQPQLYIIVDLKNKPSASSPNP